MVKVNVSRTQFSLSIAISVALTPNLRKLNFSQISPRMSESFEYMGPEQQRLHSTVDLVTDRMSDITIIILSLLCVVLTVVSLYLQKQHRALESQLHALESQSVNDSTFVKHRLLGMQLENLRQGDSCRLRRELLRESEQQVQSMEGFGWLSIRCYIPNCCGPL